MSDRHSHKHKARNALHTGNIIGEAMPDQNRDIPTNHYANADAIKQPIDQCQQQIPIDYPGRPASIRALSPVSITLAASSAAVAVARAWLALAAGLSMAV